MPVGNHAYLSASGSHRWIFCPMLPSLEAEYPNRDTVYTREGTAAHELAELKLQRDTGKISPRTFALRFKKFAENSDFYSGEMDIYTTRYADFVMERFYSYPDADIELEKRVDFSRWVPGGFGTSDVVIFNDDTLEIIDLKYGKGMPVSANQNTQMGLYALGAYAAYSMLYDFKKVRMTIVQPRLDAISSVEIFVDELLYWADNVVLPMAAQATEGIGDWDNLDEKVLRWSPVAAKLIPRAAKNFELIDRYDLQEPIYLTNEQIADILKHAGEIKKWIEDIENYALTQALSGEEVPGFKVVEGRSIRKLTDPERAGLVLKANGYVDIYKPQELLPMGSLEKLIGKQRFGELLGNLIEKPQGKPALVPNSDKRPAINSLEQARADFD